MVTNIPLHHKRSPHYSSALTPYDRYIKDLGIFSKILSSNTSKSIPLVEEGIGDLKPFPAFLEKVIHRSQPYEHIGKQEFVGL